VGEADMVKTHSTKKQRLSWHGLGKSKYFTSVIQLRNKVKLWVNFVITAFVQFVAKL
jgi:hypothetical protein